MNSLCAVASEHKTRVLNVFWLWLKQFATVAIVAYLDGKLEKNECGQSGKVLRQLAFTGSMAFCILMGIGAVYVGMRKRFARMEFFLMYFIQFTWNAILLAYAVYLLIKGSSCSMLFLLEKTLIVLILKTEIHAQVLMWAPKYIAFLHINCCTNILWPVVFLSAGTAKCAKSNTTLVLGITFFTIFFSMVSLGVAFANGIVKDTQRMKRATFFFYLLTAFIAAGLIMAAHSEKAQYAHQKDHKCMLFHVQMSAYITAEPLNFFNLVFLFIFFFSSWENRKGDEFPDVKSLKFVQEIPIN